MKFGFTLSPQYYINTTQLLNRFSPQQPMGNYTQIIDQGTANASGGTTTSNSFDVADVNNIAIQIVGDANTTDIDINSQAKTAPTAGFGTYNGASFNAQDLTTDSNNSKVYAYDVAGLNSMQIEIVNNAGTNITVDAYVAKSTVE